jgi:hypothetical protein
MKETDEVSEVVSRLREGTASETRTVEGPRGEAVEDRYELLSSYEMNALGLMRYLSGKG